MPGPREASAPAVEEVALLHHIDNLDRIPRDRHFLSRAQRRYAGQIDRRALHVEAEMKKTQLKNWIAALGIGSGVAFHSGASAQVPPEAAETPRERAELAVAAMARSVIAAPPVYVVINHEEQYSIWPAELTIPDGWRKRGGEQTLEEATTQLERRVQRLRFRVVINHEEQYSIWPVDRPLPKGFEPKGEVCQIVECAKQIGR